MTGDRQVSLHLALFGDLFAALPEAWQTDTLREALLVAYRQELHCLVNAALHPDCQQPRLVMRPWRQVGWQWVLEFWVADATLPWSPATNRYGLNVSQRRYSGAIIVGNGEVSVRH